MSLQPKGRKRSESIFVVRSSGWKRKCSWDRFQNLSARIQRISTDSSAFEPEFLSRSELPALRNSDTTLKINERTVKRNKRTKLVIFAQKGNLALFASEVAIFEQGKRTKSDEKGGCSQILSQ